MRIGHSQPSGVTWSVSGTGAAILSPTAQLDDGRPGTVTRLQWLSGTQTTASILRLRADWTSGAIVPDVVGLSNPSLPVGTKVNVAFRRASDTAGTYPYTPTLLNAGQRVFEGPRGERTALLLVDADAAPTAIVGVEFQIYNDVNGAASIAASAEFTIGEVLIRAGTEPNIDATWTVETIDPSVSSFQPERQPYTLPGVPYRQLIFRFALDDQALFFGDAAAPTVVDYEQLAAKIDRGQSCVWIPRYRDSTGAFSAQLLHRTAFVGIATKLPQSAHKAGVYFDSSTITVIEAPIPT